MYCMLCDSNISALMTVWAVVVVSFQLYQPKTLRVNTVDVTKQCIAPCAACAAAIHEPFFAAYVINCMYFCDSLIFGVVNEELLFAWFSCGFLGGGGVGSWIRMDF